MSATDSVIATHASPLTFPSNGPILVACDGAPTAHDALSVAAQCASSAFGGEIQVLGVCSPTPGVAAGMDVLPAPRELDEIRRQSMLHDVRRWASTAPTVRARTAMSTSNSGTRASATAAAGETASEMAGGAASEMARGAASGTAAASTAEWPVDVLTGAPARILASEASRRGAAMLVMGIGRHNPLDRLFGAETTLATLREATVPVLAVSAEYSSCPRLAVVGLDFSNASVHAAELALRMVGPTGRLALVHVRPKFEHPSADWQAWDVEYGRTLPPLFEKVRTQLAAPEGVIVETVTLRGDPAPALLAYAQQANADVIAVGTQHHSLMERLMVGSVATRVLRTSRCAVLAVPAVP